VRIFIRSAVANVFLQDYISCKTKPDEMASYQPFVYAFNHALRDLHNIDVPLRKSTELALLFHRTDPKPITVMHNSHLSTRKPVIILVSLDVAQNAFSEGDLGNWADYALKSAAKPPENSLKWSLCVGELRRPKSTLPSPPAKYTVKVVNEIPPQAISDADTIYETSEHLLAQKELTAFRGDDAKIVEQCSRFL
jgi:hypothetical protein